jgi:hypothetical protein
MVVSFSLDATTSQGQRAVASPWPWSATRSRALHVRCFAQQPRRLRALPARCFVEPRGQHAVDARRVFAVLCSPSATPSKTMVRHPAPLAAIPFFCVLGKKMLNRCVCLIVASRRCRASRLARSMKCRAMWTAHASSHDPFRLIDL